jgi:hypothetical protein
VQILPQNEEKRELDATPKICGNKTDIFSVVRDMFSKSSIIQKKPLVE